MTTSPDGRARITLLISDRIIHNLSESLLELACAMHHDQDIDISTGLEGPCLESLTYRSRDHLFTLLESLCKKMNYDQRRITIHTGNLIDKTTRFKVVKYNSAKGWFYGDHLLKIKCDLQKEFKYKFGNFVSNSTYPRLLLASYLHNHHKDMTIQTYRRNPLIAGHSVDLDLDKLMFESTDPEALTEVSKFVHHIPLELEDGLQEHPKTNISVGEDGDAINSNIISWYRNFFCDVVTETFFTGATFYPTEKTARPLLCMNPFVVHGPVDYLKYLKSLGFKTFSKYWPEDYDHWEGYDRCKKIYKVIDHIAKIDIKQLSEMHKDMEPILTHNKNHLLCLKDENLEEFMERFH